MDDTDHGHGCGGCTIDTKDTQRQLKDTERAARQFGSALTSAFDSVVIRGKGLTETLRSLALNFSQIALNAALRPLTEGIGSAAAKMLQGVLPFAKGGVIANGTPVPFASGGVISSPITFPLSGGRSGLAGERGPEAIMPLVRGSDGRLGVASAGGGGGQPITINISTADAQSFNRSQTQIAAMIARAAASGQRNL